MANLRLVRIKTSNSTLIRAQFTNDLNQAINTSNITITPNETNVPIPQILKVSVSKDILNITTQPLTPKAIYFIEFKSTNTVKFNSKNGTDLLLEDGATNVVTISGPEDPANPVRIILSDYLRSNIYETENRTLVSKILDSQASVLSKSLYDIRQLKNDNYLDVLITDEQKVRGAGPFDRLEEEGAYEVVRVATTRTDAALNGFLSFSFFPYDPVTLQKVFVTNEELVIGTGAGTFDGFILTLKNGPVTAVDSISVRYQAGGTATYSISSFGYQLKEPKYDTSFASTLLTLDDNQVKLSENSLSNGFVLPKSGDKIYISYQYKALGNIISEDSVDVWQVLEQLREVVQPLVTQFSLAHAPIVKSDGSPGGTGDVIFSDPNAIPPFSAPPAAFQKEIPFRLERLPKNPGEYSVDYENGRVYLYGESKNNGTGYYPPAATYKYKKSFSSNLDYTYNPRTYELVANPKRDLATQDVSVTFNYERTLIPGIDFIAEPHKEVLNERIENRIATSGSLKTLNSPITNVFRVYNETSGEIYPVTRFNYNTVFFNYSTPPIISAAVRERATFKQVTNESLIVDSEFFNILSTRVFRILLKNNKIMSATDDVIGSSYNSSAAFSRTEIFTTELYFDSQILSASANTDRLNVGQYQIDYVNGIVYVGVSPTQSLDIGTVNYKMSYIEPEHSHVTSVSNIYNSAGITSNSDKIIEVSSFNEAQIVPKSYDISDERFLNGDTTLPYTFSSGTIAVSDDVKTVRHIFDLHNLLNSISPVDFGPNATSSGTTITLSSSGTELKEVYAVSPGLTININNISPGIEIYTVSNVIRVSDGAELWDNLGTFSGYTITLSGANSPVVGDSVLVIYGLGLNASSTPIVDYNRGDYYVDYNYLGDEILVSYEYGDNCIDFRNGTLEEGTEYFTTYRVGALRDSLLGNFGTLVDLPIMNNFDTSLDRERYRDSLKAALQSFTKGPTIPAIKSIVSNIAHIEPEIIEAMFDSWSLGLSMLYRNQIDWTGDPELVSGKFDNGILISNENETVSFPVCSNLRLEDGTLEFWAIPRWDGIDNDATLTFELYRNGIALDKSSIFIGSSSYHPTIVDGKFSVNRNDDNSPVGLPATIYTKVGVFLYYDVDAKRWKLYAKDKISDGYSYTGTITSSGEIYDAKIIPGLEELGDSFRSYSNKIEFIFNIDAADAASPDGYVDGYSIIDGYVPADGYSAGYSFDGMTFMSDNEHYFFDFGESDTTNRFSIYKDGRGYLNFAIFNNGNSIKSNSRSLFKVSADISSWKAGDKHHIAASWRIGSSDRRDEMHLFIDGQEVPNILRYGGRPEASLTDRFRTVSPEIIFGVIPLPTVTYNDMHMFAGSDLLVSDSIDFSALGIVPGNKVSILELGFGTYTILAVNTNSLQINTTMPVTLNKVRFSVNPYSVLVSSEIDLASNIVVTKLSGGVETELPGLRAELPAYSISKNMSNQNVFTLLGNASVGDQILIRTLGLNHRRSRERYFMWGNTSNVIKTQLPPPVSLDDVKIYPVLLPLTPIGPSNATAVVNTFTSGSISTYQPSNNIEGRTLSVRITGGNVNFLVNPVSVTITGSTSGGPAIESINFTQPGKKPSTSKFTNITSVVVTCDAFDTTKNSTAVEIKEDYSLTEANDNTIVPIIRFSYKNNTGSNLSGGTSGVLSDLDNLFFDSDVGNTLVISSPGSVAGSYIVESRIDEHTIKVSPAPATTFSGGIYNIYNVSIGRSGFQNGFFIFELAGSAGVPYYLNEGVYEFDYPTYLEIPFDPVTDLVAHVGSDYRGAKQANSIIDELRILSKQLTDIRVGEPVLDESVTLDASALVPFRKNISTLMLLHFDSYPLTNDSDVYVSATKEYIQAGDSVNSNFSQSLVIVDRPVMLENEGYLSTQSEGTIEFWISPRFDTYNDPNDRVYFDAFSAEVESITSISKNSVKITGRASQILSVRLASDVNNTGENYFIGGSIQDDFSTIQLGESLPYQQTPVIVSYIPTGLVGDRISIYKDKDGFINFNVRAAGTDYKVTQPIFWRRDSWHRVMASFKFNRKDNKDEIRLFVDGEEKGLILFGSGLLFGTSAVFGQGVAGSANSRLTADINFNDPINQIFIGSDYLGAKIAQARFDNFKISDTSRNPLMVAGQPKDINYSSNISLVYPVIPDAYTTLLLDFDKLISKTEDFATLRDEKFGIFNFTLNIFDSFGIILDNPKVKQILESLIFALKPAQSKVDINYI